MNSTSACAWLVAAICLASLSACDSDSSSKSTAGTTSTASTTTATGVRVVDVTAPVLGQADVTIAYRLLDPAQSTADLTASYSVDGGATWSPASDGTGGDGRSGLSSGPAPGADHVWVWDSAADVPGFERSVRIRLDAPGFAAGQAAAFPVDNVPLNGLVTVTRRPYLQNSSGTSTYVLWHTAGSTDAVVEYGETPALRQRAGDPRAREQVHEVQLTGLRPGTRYYYRVVSSGVPVTQRVSFRTAPDPGTEFTLVAFGDSGTGTQEQFDLAAQMVQEQNVDLVLHLGDVIYEYGAIADPVGKYNERFFKPYAALLERAPIFPVTGNHDLLPALGGPFKQAFHLPANNPQHNELYYSFEWGDAKFVALESTARFRIPVGAHMDWLRQELNTNTRKWLIVFLHDPLYSSRGDQLSRVTRALLGPLFEHSGVDLVINGHEHIYERTERIADFNQAPGYAGIVHLTTGAAGRLRTVPNPTPHWSKVALSESSYLRLTIRADELHGACVNERGATVDSFLLRNR